MQSTVLFDKKKEIYHVSILTIKIIPECNWYYEAFCEDKNNAWGLEIWS